MLLEDIADIKTGLVTTRKKADEDSEFIKKYMLLSLNAVDENGSIDTSMLEEFQSVEELDEQYLTKQGDILVRLNKPYTTVYIDKVNEGLVIPSYFIKLKVKDKSFKPGYIAWYLNSEKVKRIFLSMQSGTLVPSINQKIVRNIKVKEKTIEEQEEILELYKLYIKEIDLIEKFKKAREKQFRGATAKLLEN